MMEVDPIRDSTVSSTILTAQTDPGTLKLWLDKLVRYRDTLLSPRFTEPTKAMHASGFLPRYLPLLPLKGDLQGWMIKIGLHKASEFFGEKLEIDIAHDNQGNVVGFALPFVPFQEVVQAAKQGWTPVQALRDLTTKVYDGCENPNVYLVTEVAISPEVNARRAMIEILRSKERRIMEKGATHLVAAHHVNNEPSARLQARRGFEEVGVTRAPFIPFSKVMLRVKKLDQLDKE